MKLSILFLVFSTVVARDNRILGGKQGKRAKSETHINHTNLHPEKVKKGKTAKSETHTTLDLEGVRLVLKNFVDSLDDDSDISPYPPPTRRDRGYNSNADAQIPEYHLCTVVQQCLDPDFILSLGLMSKTSRRFAYKALSLSMSYESFSMLQLQQHSNMLLGEMQDWVTICEGECRLLKDREGYLEHLEKRDLLKDSNVVDVNGNLTSGNATATYTQCGELRDEEKYTFWYCRDRPRMVHQAGINTTSGKNLGKYKLGDIWKEPDHHGRNSQYDYFSVYGDVNENGGAFGFRFSGHHVDLNYMWDNDGVLIKDLPVFLGHNPLIVPETTPPPGRDHDETHPRHDDTPSLHPFFDPIMWNNMAGVVQFAESVQLIVACANELKDFAPDSRVPLKEWKSTGEMGGLTLKNDRMSIRDITTAVDFNSISDDSFSIYWSMVEYTLKFARGNEPTDREREIFRSEGKAVWTTSVPNSVKGLPLNEEDLRGKNSFFYLQIETEKLLFYVMVNQLYTMISEKEPTNHLHSILIKKNLLLTEKHYCTKKQKVRGSNELCDPGKNTAPSWLNRPRPQLLCLQ